jgi:hypothetical protein
MSGPSGTASQGTTPASPNENVTPAPSPPPATAPYPAPGAPQPWTPQAAPSQVGPVAWPRWLDVGLVVIGFGAFLVFIGFLFGDGAVSQQGTGGNFNTYQGDLEAFFAVTGFGILLIVGGWIFRVVMAARKAMR